MKKKFLTVLALLTLGICLSLTGCAASGGSYSKVKVSGQQDYNYTVTSNGGNSVQYGNYVYFINGTRGYEDADQKQNAWGGVVKGALYRAELNGRADPDRPGEFEIQVTDAENTPGLEFKYTAGTDKNDGDKTVDVVNVQLIAPKVIGTTGYKEGGVFIFDEWVYYASPNNERDKSGTVQVAKTDFMRTKLDGSATQKIYTTDADSSSAPYAFYKYKDGVYMVCYFDGKIVSVRCDKKIGSPQTIAENVTGAVLPYNTTYKKGMNDNTLQDYIFYLQAATEEDAVPTGTKISFMRPDGLEEEGATVYQGSTVTLEAVRDGMLFYRTTDSSNNTVIQATNLHDALMDNSPSYAAYQNRLAELGKNLGTASEAEKTEYYENIVERDFFVPTVMSMADTSAYTSTYCFRPNRKSNVVYAVATTSSGAQLKSAAANGGTSGSSPAFDTVTFYEAAMTLSFVDGDYVYFTEGEGKTLYRTKWNVAAADKNEDGSDGKERTKEQISHTDIADNGLRADICAGYIVYVAKADEYNAEGGYTFFKKIEGVEGAKQIYVGQKIESDIKPDEEDEEDTDDSGCGSALAGGAIAGGAMLMLIGGSLLLTAYRPKNKRG